MNLLDKQWHSILWNPDTKKMMNEVNVAETVLLTGAHKAARSPDAQRRLNEVIAERNR